MTATLLAVWCALAAWLPLPSPCSPIYDCCLVQVADGAPAGGGEP